MTNLREKSYQAVLDGVLQSRLWFEKLGVPTRGTRLEQIEATLRSLVGDRQEATYGNFVAKWDWEQWPSPDSVDG